MEYISISNVSKIPKSSFDLLIMLKELINGYPKIFPSMHKPLLTTLCLPLKNCEMSSQICEGLKEEE